MPVENFVIQKFKKNIIDFIGKSWKCNIYDIIMETNYFNKYCSFKTFKLKFKKDILTVFKRK